MKDDGAFGLALLLAALAGWVDAAGFGDSKGLFLSFMSGNTTDLAASVAHQDWLRTLAIAGLIGSFVAGVSCGEIAEPWGGRRGHALILALEACLLAAGASLHDPAVRPVASRSLYPVVFAMGLQNATMHRAGGISIGLTYVTGTLVQVGRGVAGIIKGQADLDKLAKYLALWLSLAAGAALGTLALSLSMIAALALAAAGAGLLAVVTAFAAPNPQGQAAQ